MKKVLILVFILLLAGGGVWFFLLKGDKPPEEEPTIEQALEESHYYIRLRPVTTTIFRDNQPVGSFTVALTLEITDESARDVYDQRESRLHDVMFREIHAMVEHEQLTGQRIMINELKERMLAVCVAELGTEVVVDLFVSAVLRDDG